MKKIKYLLLSVVLSFWIFPNVVNAASATISIKTSGTAVVGSDVTATVTLSSGTAMGAWQYVINYDTSKLKLVSGDTSVADYTTTTSGVKSKSYTLKFKTTKSGNASINVGSYLIYANSDDSAMSVSTKNASIKIMTQAELEATYSKNNNLNSLTVEGYELSPAFSNDVNEYNVTVPSDVTSITITASKADSTATVSGDGTHDVAEGINAFEIVVRAQNGSERSFKVNVTVEDLNPITATIDGKEYQVVKRKDLLVSPLGFVESTTKINDVDVPALYSEILDLYLVGIKDSDSNISLAIVENGKITSIYIEIKSSSFTVYPLELKENSMFIDYITREIEINGKKINVYSLSKDSKVVIFYARNVEDGIEEYYQYHIDNKSIFKFDDEVMEFYNKKIQNYKYILIGCAVFIVLLLFILIIRKPKAKNNKKNKKDITSVYNEDLVNEIENHIEKEIKDEIEEDNTITQEKVTENAKKLYDELNENQTSAIKEIPMNQSRVYDIDLITDNKIDESKLSKKELKKLRKAEKKKIKQFGE